MPVSSCKFRVVCPDGRNPCCLDSVFRKIFHVPGRQSTIEYLFAISSVGERRSFNVYLSVICQSARHSPARAPALAVVPEPWQAYHHAQKATATHISFLGVTKLLCVLWYLSADAAFFFVPLTYFLCLLFFSFVNLIQIIFLVGVIFLIFFLFLFFR